MKKDTKGTAKETIPKVSFFGQGVKWVIGSLFWAINARLYSTEQAGIPIIPFL